MLQLILTSYICPILMNSLLLFPNFQTLCPYLTKTYSHLPPPLECERPFHWISMKSRLARAAKEIFKIQNWSLFTYSSRRYMAEILLIQRKTIISNQSINQSHLPAKVFSPSCPWPCGNPNSKRFYWVVWSELLTNPL